MDEARRKRFEQQILPHLPAAYSLARWLMRQGQDAEDAVQDAMIKAYRGFDGFAGEQPAAWLMAIVRNTCFTKLQRRNAGGKVVVLHDTMRDGSAGRFADPPDPAPRADEAMIAAEERRRVRAAIAELPGPFREVLVLREFHDQSYREIADIVGAPVGTVMSRLARARERLAVLLDETKTSGDKHLTKDGTKP